MVTFCSTAVLLCAGWSACLTKKSQVLGSRFKPRTLLKMHSITETLKRNFHLLGGSSKAKTRNKRYVEKHKTFEVYS